MIDTTVDIFDRLSVPTLPRLGDTPYDYRTASARETAGVLESWATRAPVVYAGDGTQTQADLATGPGIVGADASAVGGSSIGNAFSDALNHTLLGVLGIVIVAVGLFFLVKE